MTTVASDSSEYQLFKKLANPLKVDFNKPRQKTPEPEVSDAGSDGDDPPPLAPAPALPGLTFSQRFDNLLHLDGQGGAQIHEHEHVHEHEDSVREHEDEHEEEHERDDEDEHEDDTDDPITTPAVSADAHTAPPANVWSFSNSESHHPACAEEIEREKQGYLLELEKWKMQGLQTTKQYTMQDSLEDIQFEYDRIKTNMDTISGVNFMKDAMKLMFTGVELANNKMGPILHLDGWSSEVTQDMQRYNNCLETVSYTHLTLPTIVGV